MPRLNLMKNIYLIYKTLTTYGPRPDDIQSDEGSQNHVGSSTQPSIFFSKNLRLGYKALRVGLTGLPDFAIQAGLSVLRYLIKYFYIVYKFLI